MKDNPYVAIEGQFFTSMQQWITRASRDLTSHPDYLNTQHGEKTGFRGHHFTAMCFDQQGRRCRIGKDFIRAKEEDAYPIWWVWPDQIPFLLMAEHRRQIEGPPFGEGEVLAGAEE